MRDKFTGILIANFLGKYRYFRNGIYRYARTSCEYEIGKGNEENVCIILLASWPLPQNWALRQELWALKRLRHPMKAVQFPEPVRPFATSLQKKLKKKIYQDTKSKIRSQKNLSFIVWEQNQALVKIF